MGNVTIACVEMKELNSITNFISSAGTKGRHYLYHTTLINLRMEDKVI